MYIYIYIYINICMYIYIYIYVKGNHESEKCFDVSLLELRFSAPIHMYFFLCFTSILQ